MSTLPQSKYQARARRTAVPRWRTALTVALVLAIPALLAFKGLRLYSLTQQLRDDAAAIQTWRQSPADKRALASLGPLLAKARADAEDLHSEAAPLLLVTPYLGWVPRYGPDLAAAQPLVAGAADLTFAADESFQVLSPLLMGAGDAPPAPADLVRQLAAARPRLELARDAATRAREAWAGIAPGTLSARLRGPLERMQPLLPLAQGGLELAVAAPDLLDDFGKLTGALRGRPDRAQLAALGPLLAKARADTASVQDAAAALQALGPRLGGVPGYGPQLGALADILPLAADLATAGDLAFQAFAPLLDAHAIGEGTSLPLAGQLAQKRPELDHARVALARAADQLRGIDAAKLPPAWQPGIHQVAALLPGLRESLDLAFVLPDLLGVDGRREYMLLALNSDELRAGGGFISGAGVLAFDGGRVIDLSLGDSVSVDDMAAHAYPLPPEAIRQYLRGGLWVFRDTNWSPDFPTSARAAIDLYRLGQGSSPSNVVAFDPAFIQALLGVAGPVDIRGIPYPISVDNVLHEMRTPYNMPLDQGREEFKRLLARAIVAKLVKNGAQVDVLDLAQALRRALNERHLQVFIQGPVGDMFAAHGWDGAVQPGESDFLMAVDSNVGYNKANPNIRESIDYAVDLRDPRTPQAELALSYAHQSTAPTACLQRGAPADATLADYDGWMTECYFDYLRVLIPTGSQFAGAQVPPTPAEWMMSRIADDGAVIEEEGDSGTSVLSTFFVVPSGETRTTRLRYKLPDIVSHDEHGWHYRLRVQKQAGTDETPVVVRLRLPAGATVASTAPAAPGRDGDTLTFSLNLNVDQEIDVTFVTK